MKKLILILICMTASEQCISQNLVVNGDFSDGLNNWTVVRAYPSEDPSPTAKNPRVFVANVNSIGGGAAAAGGLVVQSPFGVDGSGADQGPFDIGDANGYTLSFKYGYNNIGAGAAVQIAWYDYEGNSCSTYCSAGFDWTTWPDPNPNDGIVGGYNNTSWNSFYGEPSIWIKKSVHLVRSSNFTPGQSSFVVPPNASKAKIQLRYTWTPWQAYFDDISLAADATSCGEEGTIYAAQDLNKDCYVNFKDFAQFAGAWMQTGYTNQ